MAYFILYYFVESCQYSKFINSKTQMIKVLAYLHLHQRVCKWLTYYSEAPLDFNKRRIYKLHHLRILMTANRCGRYINIRIHQEREYTQKKARTWSDCCYQRQKEVLAPAQGVFYVEQSLMPVMLQLKLQYILTMALTFDRLVNTTKVVPFSDYHTQYKEIETHALMLVNLLAYPLYQWQNHLGLKPLGFLDASTLSKDAIGKVRSRFQ